MRRRFPPEPGPIGLLARIFVHVGLLSALGLSAWWQPLTHGWVTRAFVPLAWLLGVSQAVQGLALLLPLFAPKAWNHRLARVVCAAAQLVGSVALLAVYPFGFGWPGRVVLALAVLGAFAQLLTRIITLVVGARPNPHWRPS